MPEYQCQHCGYKFERARAPLACPYCGRTGTVKPIPTANDLVEETIQAEKKEKVREEIKKERF